MRALMSGKLEFKRAFEHTDLLGFCQVYLKLFPICSEIWNKSVHNLQSTLNVMKAQAS